MRRMHDASGDARRTPAVSVAFSTICMLFICIALAAPLGQTAFAESSQATPFLGTWCAQGDPSKQTSIAASGGGSFINLTNEGGNTSMGRLKGSNQIEAPQWNFVVGTLSPNGSQINWSNGTMWARCRTGGSSGPGNTPELSGTWFANGDHSKRCSIQQRGDSLDVRNEGGQSASGSFDHRHRITTNWNGKVIEGRISQHGHRIDWSNGTYWIRDAGYPR